MSLPELVVLVLTLLGFAGALVFVLVYWRKIKFPTDVKRFQVGTTSYGTVVYLIHGKETLQEIPLQSAVSAVERVLTGWDSLRLDPRTVFSKEFQDWRGTDLDEVVIHLASYSEYDARNGYLPPDHQAACLVKVGRWFGSGVPCLLIRDGLWEPKTGEPIQHEMCHLVLHEATKDYDYRHANTWVWKEHGVPGNLQDKGSLS